MVAICFGFILPSQFKLRAMEISMFCQRFSHVMVKRYKLFVVNICRGQRKCNRRKKGPIFHDAAKRKENRDNNKNENIWHPSRANTKSLTNCVTKTNENKLCTQQLERAKKDHFVLPSGIQPKRSTHKKSLYEMAICNCTRLEIHKNW